MAPVDQPVGHRDHQRGVHRPALERMGMTEDGETTGLVGGINPRLECFPIRGVELGSLGHVRIRNSHMAPATRMITARSAEAMRSRRVCIGPRG
jgi:hypothetical protein